MKQLGTFLLTSVLFFSAQAQIGKNPTQNDPDAKKTLDAVSTKFRTYKSPQAAFTYQVENAQGKVLSTKTGTVTMKGPKYHVTMSGMEIFSDGNTSWNYDKSSNEVTISTVESGSNAMTPQKLFTNFYDRDFYYKSNGEKKVNGKTVEEIEMTPIDKTRPFHKVYLWIDKASNNIYSARFLEKTGNRYSYTVNKITPTANASDADFTFNKSKYPGVEVVDLR